MLRLNNRYDYVAARQSAAGNTAGVEWDMIGKSGKLTCL